MIGQTADVVHNAQGAASIARLPQYIFIAHGLAFLHTRRSIYTPVRRIHGDSSTVLAAMTIPLEARPGAQDLAEVAAKPRSSRCRGVTVMSILLGYFVR